MAEARDEGVRMLARYRTLCEALGVARANGVPLAAAALEELRRMEARLGELLERRDVSEKADTLLTARPESAEPEVEEITLSIAKPPARSSRPHEPDVPAPSTTLEPRRSAAPRASAATSERRLAPASDLGSPTSPREPSSLPGSREPRPNEEEARLPAAARQAAPVPNGATVATVFTDGSAEGNPGPGGYCAIVRVPGRPDREFSGGTNYTTNNKMELTAAISGLTEALASGATSVTVVTDSEYVVKGTTQWLKGWERNGWKTTSGQPVKNRELWEKIAELTRGRQIRWQWVKGHAGHPENERADLVATTRAREAATNSRG